MEFFAHERSIVESDKIGAGSKVWAFSHILPGAKIGKNVNICDHCFIENDVAIGNDVTIKCGVFLWDGIEIQDKVFIGPAAVFTNDLNPRSKNKDYKQKKTKLKTGCSIGAGAIVLPGVTIGEYAMVGAGAVVTKDVEDFSLIYGNPARQQGYVCVCGQRLFFKEENCVSCVCRKRFNLIENKVVLVE